MVYTSQQEQIIRDKFLGLAEYLNPASACQLLPICDLNTRNILTKEICPSSIHAFPPSIDIGEYRLPFAPVPAVFIRATFRTAEHSRIIA
jgi:hypothetical protein